MAGSIVLPFGIYAALLMKREISPVLMFGLGLVLLAGFDVYLLQSLATLARHSPSLADDTLFVTELSVALYLLPALSAGIGINMVSHVLISHLVQAEAQFERDRRGEQALPTACPKQRSLPPKGCCALGRRWPFTPPGESLKVWPFIAIIGAGWSNQGGLDRRASRGPSSVQGVCPCPPAPSV